MKDEPIILKLLFHEMQSLYPTDLMQSIVYTNYHSWAGIVYISCMWTCEKKENWMIISSCIRHSGINNSLFLRTDGKCNFSLTLWHMLPFIQNKMLHIFKSTFRSRSSNSYTILTYSCATRKALESTSLSLYLNSLFFYFSVQLSTNKEKSVCFWHIFSRFMINVVIMTSAKQSTKEVTCAPEKW